MKGFHPEKSDERTNSPLQFSLGILFYTEEQ